jgi:hypothetical protein
MDVQFHSGVAVPKKQDSMETDDALQKTSPLLHIKTSKSWQFIETHNVQAGLAVGNV